MACGTARLVLLSAALILCSSWSRARHPFGITKTKIAWDLDSFAVGDFTGDGTPDLVATDSYTSTMWVYEGSKDGSFDLLRKEKTPLPCTALSSGDLNGDGILDLVMLSGSAYAPLVVVRLGLGNGSFRRLPPLLGPSHWGSTELLDVDGDGILDLLVNDPRYPEQSILRGKGNGAFDLPRLISPEDDLLFLTAGQLDSTPDLEAVFTKTSESVVQIWHVFGGQQPELISELELEACPRYAWCLDADGDGLRDVIVVSDVLDKFFSVIRNAGGGVFEDPVHIKTETGDLWLPKTLRAFDKDRDGKLELLGSQSRCSKVSLYELDWEAKTLVRLMDDLYAQVLKDPQRPAGHIPFVVDMNADGESDLVIPYANTVGFFPGSEKGFAQRTRSYLIPEICLGWVKTTEHSDQALCFMRHLGADCWIGVARFGGPELVRPPSEYSTVLLDFKDDDLLHTLRVLDFNNDGLLDALGMNHSQLDLVLQQPDGTFENVIHFPFYKLTYFPGSPEDGSFSVGDFDNDGVQDIAMIIRELRPGSSRILEVQRLLPREDPPFSRIFSLPIAAASTRTYAHDIDGDGFSDIIYQPTYSQLRIIYCGEGGIRETKTLDLRLPSDFKAMAAAFAFDDFNGDGSPDLVVGHGGYGIVAFFGTGNAFSPPRRFLRNFSVRWLLVGDVNGDGFKDLVAEVSIDVQNPNQDRYLATLWGSSDDPLAESDLFLFNDVFPIEPVFLRDLDGDELPELIMRGFLAFWNHSIEPPTAEFVIDRPRGYTPLTVTLSYTGETETTGLVLKWDLGDGTYAEGEKVVHTYRVEGNEPQLFSVTLTAENRAGKAQVTHEIWVYPPLSYDFEAEAVPEDALCVRFRSTEASPFLSSFYWVFGDGSFSKDPEPLHCFRRSGLYEVTCTVQGPAEGEPGNSLLVSHTVEVGYRFVRGDANADGRLTLDDVIHIAYCLFGLSQPLNCEDAFDTNDSGKLDLADVLYLATYLFRSGPPCPAPFPDPGIDPTPDGIECR